MKTGLQISQIEIYRSDIKLKEPFITSLGVHDYAQNIIVVIKTNNGLTGFGECSPFITINGETVETCFIVAQYLAKGLIGKDPLNSEECSLTMDRIIFGNSSIKSAFDIAFYDIAAQNARVPLYVFLGGNNNKTLTTDYTVSIADSHKMASDAKKIKDAGFPAVKVKLGETKEKDVERIQLIRQSIGDTLPLRIDANQGWDTETAIGILKALEPFNIEFCEEPIPRWEFMELPKVRRQSPIKIMADESCCDHHDAKRLIDLNACDYINVKLGKSSGFFKAQKIIKEAEQAKIEMQVGGFLESRLGFTASAHLALSSTHIVYCDFDTPLMFEEDIVSGGITYENKGVISVPHKIGLGASIDQTHLQKLPKAVIN